MTEKASGLGAVTPATIIAAASGYLVLLLAAEHLGAAGYAVFAVFWAAYGMVTGTQNGQLQETARGVRSGSEPGAVSRAGSPLVVNVVIGALLAGLVALSSPLWAERVFSEHVWLSVLLLACGVASFAMYAHVCGALSGAGAWRVFAVVLSVDALLRLAGAALAVTAGWGLTSFLVITVIGSASWLMILMCSPTARRCVGLTADAPTRTVGANTLTAMAAAAAAAVLVMGFPVLIRVADRPDDDPAVLGAIILALTLTRAPLLVPLNSFQGVLIARFVTGRHRPFASLLAPTALVVGVGLVGALAAGLLGGWLLTTFFGPEFDLPGSTLAWLTLGATTLAVLTVTGACMIAVGAHRIYAAGWWIATIISALMLAIPLELGSRVAVALLCGPIIGAGVHLLGLRAAMTAVPRANP